MPATITAMQHLRLPVGCIAYRHDSRRISGEHKIRYKNKNKLPTRARNYLSVMWNFMFFLNHVVGVRYDFISFKKVPIFVLVSALSNRKIGVLSLHTRPHEFALFKFYRRNITSIGIFKVTIVSNPRLRCCKTKIQTITKLASHFATLSH